MIHITYKKKGINITQVWYSDATSEWKLLKTDLFFVHGVYEKGKKGVWQTFHSLLTDLTASEEDMLAAVHKNFKYQIRRSQREDVSYRMYSAKEIMENADLLDKFAAMYEAMYSEKGMKQTLNKEQILLYAKADALMISIMMMGEEIAVVHSYIVGEDTARLLHSVSEFRREDMDANFIARCNKRHHWEDLCYFKQMGIKEYDWGGISSFDNPNGIDDFKSKFGGKPVTYYNQFEAGSFLGKILLLGLNLKMKN